MAENIRDLLVRGSAAARAGEADEAKFFLDWVLRLDPPIEYRLDALYWLASVSREPARKRELIEDMLAFDPGEPRARRELAMLDGRLNPADVINPDQFRQAIPADPTNAAARRFVCPKCGGKMAFSPDGQSLLCDYCDGGQGLGAAARQNIVEGDFYLALATQRGHSKPVTVHIITCQGCGAAFMLGATQLTSNCPYCNTPYALNSSQEKEIVSPHAVIPFKVSESRARELLIPWVKKNFARHKPKIERGKGFFLPMWTFDIGGTLEWSYQIQERKGTKTIRGSKTILRDDILVLGTDKLPQALLNGMWNYEMEEMAPFDERYLADWMAETYTISPSDASLQAREYSLSIEKERAMVSLPVSESNISFSSARMYVDSFKLVLLPVWLSHYELEGRSYSFMINGQTGEITAEKP